MPKLPNRFVLCLFYISIELLLGSGISYFESLFILMHISTQLLFNNMHIPIATVTTDSSSVTDIKHYALRGHYENRFDVAANTTYTINHNLGVDPLHYDTFTYIKFKNGTRWLKIEGIDRWDGVYIEYGGAAATKVDSVSARIKTGSTQVTPHQHDLDGSGDLECFVRIVRSF